MKRYIIAIVFLCISVINSIIIIKKVQKEHEVSCISGQTIFIDPGHGGKDNGTSFNDIYEDELNLEIAKKLHKKLFDLDAKVLLSRVADYDLSDMYAKNHKTQDLCKRIQYMKDNNVDLFVSIHLNSYSSEDVSGAQVFYKINNIESQKFSEIMQSTLNELNKKEKKAKKGDFYLLNNSGDINGIIIECGFLSNTQERAKLSTDSYQNKLANLIKEGIIKYLSLRDSI